MDGYVIEQVWSKVNGRIWVVGMWVFTVIVGCCVLGI